MSDWSSFNDDKATFDAWREFLNEEEVTELEEGVKGFFGDLAAKAGSAASSAMDKARQSKLGFKLGQKFSGMSKGDLAKAACFGSTKLQCL